MPLEREVAQVSHLSSCIFALVVTTGAVGPAAAEPCESPQTDKAARHRDRAFRRFRAGDHAAAIAEFRQAYTACPLPSHLFNIALTYGNWRGHCTDAMDGWRRYLGFCESYACDPNKVSDGRERLARLGQACPSQVNIETTPGGAAIAIDGAYAGNAPLATSLEPGPHEVSASLDGFVSGTQAIEVQAGKRMAVAITLRSEIAQGWLLLRNLAPGASVRLDGTLLSGPLAEPISVSPGRHGVEVARPGRPSTLIERVVQAGEKVVVDLALVTVPPAAAMPPPLLVAASPEPAASVLGVLGWASIGLGCAGLAVGGVLSGIALGKAADADAIARGDVASSDPLGEANQRRREANETMRGAAVALGTGGAVLATGVILLLVDLLGDDVASGEGVAPVAEPNAFGVMGRF